MSWHCTVLRARELFVLRMRTLTIQYPDPWGKSAIPNKENSPPCPGRGEVGANIDRCINGPPFLAAVNGPRGPIMDAINGPPCDNWSGDCRPELIIHLK